MKRDKIGPVYCPEQPCPGTKVGSTPSTASRWWNRFKGVVVVRTPKLRFKLVFNWDTDNVHVGCKWVSAVPKEER